MISGATYSGVPQNVHVFRPEPIFLAKPKSTYKQKNQLVYSQRNVQEMFQFLLFIVFNVLSHTFLVQRHAP